MNGQTKLEIIAEMLDDLEAERAFSLLPEKRQEVEAQLWPYLDGIESCLNKIERKI